MMDKILEKYNNIKMRLENNVVELESKKKNYEDEYNTIINDLLVQESCLEKIKKEKEEFTYAMYPAIERFIKKIQSGSLIVLAIIYAYALIQMTVSASLMNFNGTLISILLILGGSVGIAITNGLFLPLLKKKLENNSRKGIMNSIEYKDILDKEKEVKDRINCLEIDAKNKEIEVINISNEIGSLLSLISNEKLIKNFIEANFSHGRFINYEKSYVRKRIKENKDNNKI